MIASQAERVLVLCGFVQSFLVGIMCGYLFTWYRCGNGHAVANEKHKQMVEDVMMLSNIGNGERE
jgi:hypothetical protein